MSTWKLTSPSTGPRPAASPLWVYSYEISPPQSRKRLREVRAILDQENAAARRESRTWAGRLVDEERVTHVLIVSDSPLQHGSVNRRLEDALKKIDATGLLTVPMPVPPEVGGAKPDRN